MHTYLQKKAIALNYADFAKGRPECKAFYKAFADAVITLGVRYVAQEGMGVGKGGPFYYKIIFTLSYCERRPLHYVRFRVIDGIHPLGTHCIHEPILIPPCHN
jgi:hypothetical protein